MITISNDKMFALIQHLKEYRALLKATALTPADYTLMFRVKVQYETLNELLKQGGIDRMFDYTVIEKNKLETDRHIKEQALKEEEQDE